MSKIDGQLERAQLENIAASSPTPTPVGRIYLDTSVVPNVPRIYTGAAWQPVNMGQTAALYDNGNSGRAITINWANGRNQKLTLSNHCVISFSNPVAGEVHRLAITQVPTEGSGVTTGYMYRLDMCDMLERRLPFQPLGVLQSGEVQQHSWFYAAAVRAATTSIDKATGNPITLPGTASTGIGIHPKTNALFLGQSSSPFGVFYPFVDGGIKALYGTQNITTPFTNSATTTGVDYSPDGQAIFTTSGTTPFIKGVFLDVYGNGSGTAFADPGTVPTGAAKGVAVHPSGSHVVVAHTTTPFISCYPIATTGFGTKISNPSSVPAGNGLGVAWAPTGDFLAVAHATSPFISVYAFDPVTGFGAKSSDPLTLPAGVANPAGGRAIAWRPQSDWIAMISDTSPFLYVVPFNRATGAFGTAFNVTALNASAKCVAFSQCGQYLLVGSGSAPFLYVFAFDGGLGIVGTTYSFLGSNPGQQVNDIAVHYSNEIVSLALNASPFIMTYPMPRMTKNYIRQLS